MMIHVCKLYRLPMRDPGKALMLWDTQAVPVLLIRGGCSGQLF